MKRIAVALVLTAASPALAQLLNGGFETGDLTGWRVASSFPVYVDDFARHSGDFGVDMSYPSVYEFEQDLPLPSGADVLVSFWLRYSRPGGEAWEGAVGASFDGQTLLDLTQHEESFDWTFFSFPVTVGHDNPTLHLLFGLYYESQNFGYWHLDDVAVTPVPTPSAFAALCLCGLVTGARRPPRRVP